MSYSWTLPGQRKRVPYENPQGRRINVLAALVADGPQPSLTWGQEQHGALVAEQLLDFLHHLPRLPDKPLVVVLDNGSMHVNWVVKEARLALRRQRIYLYYLPPYSPKLNRIEATFGVIKRQELPRRSYATLAALEQAIDDAFTAMETKLLAKTTPQLRPAA